MGDPTDLALSTLAEAEAGRRAGELLAQTDLFDELGLARLAAAARTLARENLELLETCRAERSARRAAQEENERLRQIIARR